MTIIAAYQDAGTYRGAAAICGTTPKTVKRVIQRAQAGGVRPVPKLRARNYEVVADLVAERVKKSAGRISAKRLLAAARTAGYVGSDRNFRRLVAQVKKDWRVEHHRGRRPAIWSPGEHLVIDWGSQGGVHVFCAVLAWSRWRFVRFAADEKSVTTLAMLGECFAELGGTPQVVLADRMGCLKGGVVANRVVPTGDYVRFALHYRFRPDFCEAADPESKGIVENLVGYAKSDLLTPLLLGDELDLNRSNEAAKAWCQEVNAAMHADIAAVPEQRLAQERLLLGTLPSLQLRIGPAPVLRKVDKLSCVRIGSARYSVPMKLIGTSVQVVSGTGRVLIVDPRTGQVVADHGVVAPGDSSVADEHYGGARPKPRRAIRPRTVAEKAFCGLGSPAEAFLAGAAAAGHTRLGPGTG
jgi:transposase